MTTLQEELQQGRPFRSREQDAFLSIGRTWSLLDHAFSEALKPHGITTTQYNVLRILRGAGDVGLCRAAVMDRMVSRVPDATRLLDRLERSGLIARQRDPSDRRFVKTRITAKGLATLGALDRPVQQIHRDQLGHIEESELAELMELLARIRGAL